MLEALDLSGIISWMGFNIANQQAGGYRVSTPIYEGPLDLLLHLIERAELDITKLALAQVTDQYLGYIHSIQDRAALEVSAFLVIASRLVQIKSEALLPRPPARVAGEEDPGEALAQQLRVYKRFREIANVLAQRQQEGLHTFLRLAPPPKVEASPDLSNLTLADLVAAARAIFNREDDRLSLESVVSAPRITIREKIDLIVKILHQRGHATFRSLLLSGRSRLETVVTFLALLELIKWQRVRAEQANLFGDIELKPANTLSEDDHLELEFGE